MTTPPETNATPAAQPGPSVKPSVDAAAAARPFAVTHASVFRIAVPMTFAFVTTPLVGLTDTAVVGRAGDASALAGLAVGALIFDFAFSTFNFLRMGTTGLVAQADGRGDKEEAALVVWRALLLGLGIGLALILLQPLILALGLLVVAPGPEVRETIALYVFLRMFSAPFALLNYALLGAAIGFGRGGIGLALQFVINGVNIAASIVLGLVLDYGIAGVAIGTLLGEAVGALVGIVVIIRLLEPGTRRPGWRIFRRREFLRMVAVNRDIMIRSLCLLGSFALFARYGAALGPVTLAVNGVLLNFFMVTSFVLDGLASAAEQLAGKAIGARWRPAFERTVRLAVCWSAVFALCLAGAFILGGRALVGALTTSAAVREGAESVLFLAALTPVFGVLAFVMDGIFIGATWSAAMRNAMIASFVFFAGAGWALTDTFGNDGLWIALLAFLASRGLVLLVMLPGRTREAFPGSG